ncbi:hypothetical protein J6590_035246 [Homalodisca vitripennis]|nr:hypothetical protein J6590_035246 [Homalodisca vitripennis]
MPIWDSQFARKKLFLMKMQECMNYSPSEANDFLQFSGMIMATMKPLLMVQPSCRNRGGRSEPGCKKRIILLGLQQYCNNCSCITAQLAPNYHNDFRSNLESPEFQSPSHVTGPALGIPLSILSSVSHLPWCVQHVLCSVFVFVQ